jgi:hypothetical protein
VTVETPTGPGARQKATSTVNINTTDTLLDNAAADLNAAAREAAHAAVAPCTTEEYVAAYLDALAKVLGAESAEQCAPGETWAPAAWLEGDREAIHEATKLLDVDLDHDDWKRLFGIYCSAEVQG